MTTQKHQEGVTIEQGLPAEEQPREAALPQKKQRDTPIVPWWKRPVVIASLTGLAAIGLIVGLSVGLAQQEAEQTPPPTDEGDPGPTTNVTAEELPPPLVPANALRAIGAESLTPYPDCEALQADLEAAALYLANSKIDSTARMYYHNEWRPGECFDCVWGGEPTWAPAPLLPTGAEPDVDDSGAQGDAPTAAAPTDGEDSYQTNVQVEGVDEADFVKSDGEHVYAIYGNEVVVWDVDRVSMQSRTPIVIDFDVTGATELDEDGHIWGDDFHCYSNLDGMLLFEDRLVVISSGGCYFYGYEWENGHTDSSILPSDEGTYVQVYDVSTIPSDGDSPLTQVGETFIHGRYLSARSIESNVHIVTSGYINPYSTFTQFLDRYNFDLYPYDLSEYDFRLQAQEMARDLHQDFARDLLVELQDATNDETCEKLVRLSLFQSGEDTQEQLEFTGNGVLGGLTFVTSFDLSNDNLSVQTTDTSAMFSPMSYMTVYSSAERLVLAGQGWNGNEEREWREETFLISYRLNGTTATPVAVSHVPGYLLNQFSLDHLNKDGKDYLRVATTNSEVWGLGEGREWTQTEESSSQVMILEEAGDESMEMVGMVEDIGLGERIYSVRFLGDKAFVVTFRQTDPFFTIDLSDVTNPTIAGELKIPGFSNYLHPIDGDLILAVGQNADEETGWTTGLQISLFDVSDFSNPQRIQHYTETSDSFSHAQYDHRAFRYLPETQVLILPVEVYDWPGDYFDGFVVYNVTTEEIAPRFRIEHADANAIEYGCWGYSYFPGPRSLVFEGKAMTIKTHTVLLHDLATQEAEGSLNLDEGLDHCSGWYWR